MKSEVRSPKSEANRTLVCFALQEEAAPFRKLASGKSGVFILITGIGRKNAETAVGKVLALEKPALVLTCGFAGGLNPTLNLGDVVFETSDNTIRTTLLAAGAKPAEFFCAGRMITTVAEKRLLRDESGADVVEMESEAIYWQCFKADMPCATVRVISDTANEDLPLDFNQLAKSDLNIDYGKLALAIVTSPGKIPDLLRLRKQTRFAAERLAAVLEKTLWP